MLREKWLEKAQILGLAYVGKTRVSTTELFEAGLGEKGIDLMSLISRLKRSGRCY